MKIAAALLFLSALCMIVTHGNARSLRKQIEKDEMKLVEDEMKLLSRMKRHQADTLFNHYRRKNYEVMSRRMYLKQLLRRINKRSVDYEFMRNDDDLARYALEILENMDY